MAKRGRPTQAEIFEVAVLQINAGIEAARAAGVEVGPAMNIRILPPRSSDRDHA
jgi:hypothetical protein